MGDSQTLEVTARCSLACGSRRGGAIGLTSFDDRKWAMREGARRRCRGSTEDVTIGSGADHPGRLDSAPSDSMPCLRMWLVAFRTPRQRGIGTLCIGSGVHVVHVLEAVALDRCTEGRARCEFEQVLHIMDWRRKNVPTTSAAAHRARGCDRESVPEPAAKTMLPCLAITGNEASDRIETSTVFSTPRGQASSTSRAPQRRVST